MLIKLKVPKDFGKDNCFGYNITGDVIEVDSNKVGLFLELGFTKIKDDNIIKNVTELIGKAKENVTEAKQTTVHVCNNCGAKFANEKALAVHIKNTHGS